MGWAKGSDEEGEPLKASTMIINKIVYKRQIKKKG